MGAVVSGVGAGMVAIATGSAMFMVAPVMNSAGVQISLHSMEIT
jgi:hypothetical protein